MLSIRLGHPCLVYSILIFFLLSLDDLTFFLTDMINIFEVFLPQLLRYPNPNDPLNGEAAALLMRHPKEYDIKVKGRLIELDNVFLDLHNFLQSMFKDLQRKKLRTLRLIPMKTKTRMRK